MKPEHALIQQHFLEIYEAYHDELFRFCLLRTRSRDQALDMVQETFTKTWDYLRGGKKLDQARGFLYRVAKNTIIDASRKKTNLSLDHLLEQENHYEPSADLPLPEEVHHMRDALHELVKLPEHHREILQLRFLQDLTLQEIAAIYQENENTISVRIHRALKQARNLLSSSEDEIS
jgi:RNA polymerase sigma-70 factor (ECF subfamily)